MARIEGFERKQQRSVEACEADPDSDTVHRWEHEETGVVVAILVEEYPRTAFEKVDGRINAVTVSSYRLEVSGGKLPESFDQAYDRIDVAKSAAWDLLYEIADDPAPSPTPAAPEA